MKKLSMSFVLAGLLLGSAPIDAAVSKTRAIKCALPGLRKQFKCNAAEITEGKKWLKGASIAAAAAAVAAAVAIAVGVAQKKSPSQLKAEITKAKQEPTLEELRVNVAKAFPARETNRQQFMNAYEALRSAFGGDTVKTQDYIIAVLPAFKTEVLDKGYFLRGPL